MAPVCVFVRAVLRVLSRISLVYAPLLLAERRVPLARHLPPDDRRREPREAPGDEPAKPLVPAVAPDGGHQGRHGARPF